MLNLSNSNLVSKINTQRADENIVSPQNLRGSTKEKTLGKTSQIRNGRNATFTTGETRFGLRKANIEDWNDRVYFATLRRYRKAVCEPAFAMRTESN